MEGDDEEFKALIYKYEILHNKPSLYADSDETISFLEQPSRSSSNGSPLATVPKEISLIHELRSTWQLQKEIYELETKKQEKILIENREQLYKSFQNGQEIIGSVVDDLHYVDKNKANIEKILNTEIGENFLPIPRHLHEKTVGLFKMLYDICNNYESIIDTFEKEVDFEEAFTNLSEAVHNKNVNALKREIYTVGRYLALLKTMSVSGGEDLSVQYQHTSTCSASNKVTT